MRVELDIKTATQKGVSFRIHGLYCPKFYEKMSVGQSCIVRGNRKVKIEHQRTIWSFFLIPSYIEGATPQQPTTQTVLNFISISPKGHPRKNILCNSDGYQHWIFGVKFLV
jgi:hypothetical protein